MELDLPSLFGLLCQLYSLAETPQLPHSPCSLAHIQGRYWSAKIDDISLSPSDLSGSPGCQKKQLSFVEFTENFVELFPPL